MPYPTNHLPMLHDVELCRQAYEMRAADPEIPYQQIATAIATKWQKETIRRWLIEPERYSPYVDSVAVDRAYQEPEVYKTLSTVERWAFWDRWAPVVQAEYDRKNVNDCPVRDHFCKLLDCNVGALNKLIQSWQATNAGRSS